ncbi:hypothetical protein LTR37_002466 [Vermiconidia calcicola]|uniref:Uncharacterized protein n=1 Tax=Vermiconidia calcicola TaxID=1690605 RepID=A0ACC3NT19_9PEZI|nr:hypothetical protein LTR37_002466 [Vermiconidia calcicola]
MADPHPRTTAPESQEDTSFTPYRDPPESVEAAFRAYWCPDLKGQRRFMAGFRAARERRQRSADNLKAPLLAIPLEVRTLIYGFVITETMKSLLLNDTRHPRSALSATCRALRAEYRPFQETEGAILVLRSIYYREYIDRRPWTRVRPFIRAAVVVFTLPRSHYNYLSSA